MKKRKLKAQIQALRVELETLKRGIPPEFYPYEIVDSGIFGIGGAIFVTAHKPDLMRRKDVERLISERFEGVKE